MTAQGPLSYFQKKEKRIYNKTKITFFQMEAEPYIEMLLNQMGHIGRCLVITCKRKEHYYPHK